MIAMTESARKRTIRIGGASGFWGESSLATGQLLGEGALDYLVYDYLAEITMSIMARARAADPALGYAVDFVTAALRPNLAEIERQGVKVISNAGGVNPGACAAAVRQLIEAAGLDLRVAVVSGDDLLPQAAQLASAHPAEMFSGAPFPPIDRLASINAYLGAFPIAEALDAGADIVITGRVVDSAVTLGACIHAFGWGGGRSRPAGRRQPGGTHPGVRTAGHRRQFHRLGVGCRELCRHRLPDRRGSRKMAPSICTKPTGTGGLVTPNTVGEQMLYEIGDPQAYVLPDVVCDFSRCQAGTAGCRPCARERRPRLSAAGRLQGQRDLGGRLSRRVGLVLLRLRRRPQGAGLCRRRPATSPSAAAGFGTARISPKPASN